MLPDYNELMNKLKSYETLIQMGENRFECFLKNHPKAAAHYYGVSHGHLILDIFNRDDSCYVYLSIRTIDDGSMCFNGPNEVIEKAVRRIDRIKEHINLWDGWVPNHDEASFFCSDCGMFRNE